MTLKEPSGNLGNEKISLRLKTNGCTEQTIGLSQRIHEVSTEEFIQKETDKICWKNVKREVGYMEGRLKVSNIKISFLC